jgi:hypothetical protein
MLFSPSALARSLSFVSLFAALSRARLISEAHLRASCMQGSAVSCDSLNQSLTSPSWGESAVHASLSLFVHLSLFPPVCRLVFLLVSFPPAKASSCSVLAGQLCIFNVCSASDCGLKGDLYRTHDDGWNGRTVSWGVGTRAPGGATAI